MTEIIKEQYYNKDKFVNIHVCSKVSIEYFLAKLLFKDDLTRVLYSTLDFTFRKRLEQIDTANGKVEEAEVNMVSLGLPYASYFQESNWEPDDRVASMSAAEMCIGHYDMNTFSRLRAMAVKAPYKATIFFGRDDDARVAHQLLSWEQNPKSPILMYNYVKWHGQRLVIPTFVTIDKIEYNPDFKQSDWLTKARIIPITVEMTVRSYTIRLPNVEKVATLPIKFGERYEDSYDEENERSAPLVEEAILQFALDKEWGIAEEKAIAPIDDSIGALTPKYFAPDELSQTESASLTRTVNEYTTDILKGYFSDSSDVALNFFKINLAKSTPKSLCLQFAIKPSDYQYFEKMVILIPAHDEVVVTDCKQKEVMLDGLYPNSEYHLTILTYSQAGNIKTFKLTGRTPDSPDNLAPSVDAPKKVFNGSLVGRQW